MTDFPVKPDWLEWSDSVIGVIGFTIAIWQSWEARRAAEGAQTAAAAAQAAAIDARRDLSERLSLLDVASVAKSIGEIQGAVRSERFETALVLLQQVRHGVAGLRGKPGMDDPSHLAELRDLVLSLRKLEDSLEAKIQDATVPLNVVAVNAVLADGAVRVTEWGSRIALRSGHKGAQ